MFPDRVLQQARSSVLAWDGVTLPKVRFLLSCPEGGRGQALWPGSREVSLTSPLPSVTPGMSTFMIEPGARLANRYRLDELVSETSGASLWKATDETLARPVGAWTFADGFSRTSEVVRAARAASRVSDARVTQVFDADESGPTPYVVQEWISGTTLSDLLRNGPLEPERAAGLIAEAAEALAAAAQVGIHHLRLTPDKLVWSVGGAVKVIGLGLDAALHNITVDDPQHRRPRTGPTAVRRAHRLLAWARSHRAASRPDRLRTAVRTRPSGCGHSRRPQHHRLSRGLPRERIPAAAHPARARRRPGRRAPSGSYPHGPSGLSAATAQGHLPHFRPARRGRGRVVHTSDFPFLPPPHPPGH